MFALLWKSENMKHLERNSFDQNMRATSEVSLRLFLVVGRQLELQDEKIIESVNEEREFMQHICSSWISQSKEKNSES